MSMSEKWNIKSASSKNADGELYLLLPINANHSLWLYTWSPAAPCGWMHSLSNWAYLAKGIKQNPKIHAKVPFGAYCHVHEEPLPSHSMKSCTRGAISLRKTGNIQGSVHLICLNTGKLLKLRIFSEVSMQYSVIRRVEEMAQKEGIQGGSEFRNGWMEQLDEDDVRDKPPLIEQELDRLREILTELLGIPVVSNTPLDT